MTRLEKINELLSGTAALSNGAEFDEDAGRYLVVEKGYGEWIWAMSCKDLQECAEMISQSDTDREYVTIYDLDSAEQEPYTEHLPILTVTRIVGGGVDFCPTVRSA